MENLDKNDDDNKSCLSTSEIKMVNDNDVQTLDNISDQIANVHLWSIITPSLGLNQFCYNLQVYIKDTKGRTLSTRKEYNTEPCNTTVTAAW